MNNLERTSPQAPEYERAVLGCMLNDPANAVKPVLDAGCCLFYKPEYEIISKAIEDLYEHGEPVDQITVTETLKKKNQLEIIGGESCIAALIVEWVSSANLIHYIEILKEKAAIRGIISAGNGMTTAGYASEANPGEIIASLEVQVSDIKELIVGKHRNLTDDIREWTSVTEGDFSVTQVDKELHIVTKRDKTTRRKILQRLKEEKVIEVAGNREG